MVLVAVEPLLAAQLQLNPTLAAKVPHGVGAATLSLLFLLDRTESTLSSMMHKEITFFIRFLAKPPLFLYIKDTNVAN